MMPRSLRSRVLFGALLWTFGLLAIAHIVYSSIYYRMHLLLLAHDSLMLFSAIVCLVAGLSQVRRGLSSLDRLRDGLVSVKDGAAGRIEGAYPTEVQPIVDELNAFLATRETTVARAISKAGDLAHGLKTPLAVLSQEAAHAAETGHPALASSIDQQVERMRRQVDYHLAHARAAACGATAGTRCVLATSVEGLARTLQRLHADRGVTIRVEVSPAHAVRVQREDLDEMLGNLLDNACKWATGQVSVSSSGNGDRVEILVDDDGPGIVEALRSTVLRRGVRADEAPGGSGLGLAIVCDLVELYGGTIDLHTAAAGGLRARLVLPAA